MVDAAATRAAHPCHRRIRTNLTSRPRPYPSRGRRSAVACRTGRIYPSLAFRARFLRFARIRAQKSRDDEKPDEDAGRGSTQWFVRPRLSVNSIPSRPHGDRHHWVRARNGARGGVSRYRVLEAGGSVEPSRDLKNEIRATSLDSWLDASGLYRREPRAGVRGCAGSRLHPRAVPAGPQVHTCGSVVVRDTAAARRGVKGSSESLCTDLRPSRFGPHPCTITNCENGRQLQGAVQGTSGERETQGRGYSGCCSGRTSCAARLGPFAGNRWGQDSGSGGEPGGSARSP